MIYLILPNYAQSSKIFTLTFDNKEKCWKAQNYSIAISTLGLPKSWARGIPAPIHKKHHEDDFVLGQIAVSSKGKHYQSWACCAGKDITDRDVFLTVIIEDNSKNIFPSNDEHFDDIIINSAQNAIINSNDSAEHYEINDSQTLSLRQALKKIFPLHNSSAYNIQKMVNKASDRRFKHYASVSFEGMSRLPDSEQEDNNGGLPFGLRSIVIILIILIFLAVFYANLAKR